MKIINSVFPVFGWLILVFVIALICKNQFPQKKELIRKIIHIGTGPIIPIAWWIGLSKDVALFIAIIITIGLILNYQFRLISAIEDIERKSYGTIAYGLSITLLILLFWPKYIEAITSGILVMSFGDGLAGIIGKEMKSKNWQILKQRKSIAGTTTMALTTLFIIFVMTLITGANIAPIEIIFIGFLATGLEQISIWGIDNLTVPIGVALSWITITNV